jgi:hypothetical protein
VKVAVVGCCGSGKSTVVTELIARGFDAYVVGQEHSAIENLWARRSPDALIYLDVPLKTLRERRSPDWPEWLYDQQHVRLKAARDSATLQLDTSLIGVNETIWSIVQQLNSRESDQSSVEGETRPASSRTRDS